MLFGSFKCEKILIITAFLWGAVVVNAQEIEKEIYQAVDSFIVTKDIEKLKQQELFFSEKAQLKKEKLALVILLCNKAFYLKDTNKTNLAIRAYEKAWSIFAGNDLNNYDIVEYCLKPLGNLYIRTKNYTSAENTIKHYMFLAGKNHQSQQKIAGVINLSLLYQSIGKHTEVVKLINAVNAKEGSTNQYKKIQRILQNSKQNLNTKNTKNYHKLYVEFQKNNKKHTVTNLPIRERVKKYLEEAQLLLLIGNKNKAEKKLESVIHEFFPNINNISSLQKENLYTETLLIDTFDLLAEITPKNEKKLKLYENSFYISELLEREITSQEAKIIHQNDNRKRSEKCIEILYELYKNTANENYFKQALFYANIFKSKVLTEVARKKALFKKNPNDFLLQERNKLIQLQEKITEKLISEQILKHTSLKISELGKRLARISIQLKKVEQKINKKYKIENTTISLQKIEEKLQNKKLTLVNYLFGNNTIYQFLIQGKEKTFRKINITTNEIVNYIRFFNDPSQINNNIERFTKASFFLYKKLQINEVNKENNLVVIPDGLLNFIPFETLITQTTKETNFTKMPFLVKTKQVIYNTSLFSFLQEQKTISQRNLLGVFPVFSNSNLALKYSLNEKESIKKVVKSTILLQEKATKENFIKQANRFDILHFSTHAEANSNTPYIHFYKDKLTLNELYSLNLTSNLAVLSACETGVGTLQKGEGVMSIARGFKYAGVENVLFSLWKINDKSTSIIMDYFYSALKLSKSVGYANWQSKKAYLLNKKIINSKKSPYYWGAFVYYGAFEKETSKNNFLLILLSLITALLVFLSVRKVRIKKTNKIGS